MATGPGGRPETIAVSIHGPAGVLDLVVPPGAAAADLAREYAAQASLATIPLIYTRAGSPVRPDVTLLDAGVGSGDVLVAATAVHRATATGDQQSGPTPEPDRSWTPIWVWVAGVAAGAAGLAAGHGGEGPPRDVTVALLLLAALGGVLPVGRGAQQRVLAAPAFAGAAALVVLWDPEPARLPLVVGSVALAAAVAAAVGRALTTGPDEGLRVWMAAGIGLFVLAGAAAVLGFSPAVVWSVALVAAVLAARFVPAYAVDVPDDHLIDLDRLAVTAWSAREQRPGRRGRTVVSPAAVAQVATRAARTVTASAAAIAVVAPLAAHQLLTRVQPAFDRVGVQLLVFFAGATLLLTARSHRHAGPRALLRVAGLACWALQLGLALGALADGRRAALLGVSIALGVLLVVVAVATGRGWRSVWWSRRAEVAEGFSAAAALAAVVVSTGLFRALWEAVP